MIPFHYLEDHPTDRKWLLSLVNGDPRFLGIFHLQVSELTPFTNQLSRMLLQVSTMMVQLVGFRIGSAVAGGTAFCSRQPVAASRRRWLRYQLALPAIPWGGIVCVIGGFLSHSGTPQIIIQLSNDGNFPEINQRFLGTSIYGTPPMNFLPFSDKAYETPVSV